MRLSEVQGNHVIDGYFPGHATAGTEVTHVIGVAPFAGTITAVDWYPDADVTGAATNNFMLWVQNRGTDGSGDDSIAETTYASGTDATANVPNAQTLSDTLTLAAGDVIAVAKSVNGSGLACPAGHVVITFTSLGD